MQRLVVLLAGASALLASGCSEGGCPQGQMRSNVMDTYGHPTREYVCVRDPNFSSADIVPAEEEPDPPANDDPGYSFGTGTPPTPPADDADSGTGSPPPPPPPACSAGSPGEFSVRLVPRPGKAPVPSSTAPDDGAYVLVQADLFVTDGGSGTPPALRELAATLSVNGARLDFVAQATGGVPESTTMTLAGGVLTKVCQVGDGAASSALVPGAAGATEPAAIGWDGAVLDVVVYTKAGAIALAFTPRG